MEVLTMLSSTCFSKVKDCSKASGVAALKTLKLLPFIWSLDRTCVRQTFGPATESIMASPSVLDV